MDVTKPLLVLTSVPFTSPLIRSFDSLLLSWPSLVSLFVFLSLSISLLYHRFGQHLGRLQKSSVTKVEVERTFLSVLWNSLRSFYLDLDVRLVLRFFLHFLPGLQRTVIVRRSPCGPSRRSHPTPLWRCVSVFPTRGKNGKSPTLLTFRNSSTKHPLTYIYRHRVLSLKVSSLSKSSFCYLLERLSHVLHFFPK